jgi:hypothetical protein
MKKQLLFILALVGVACIAQAQEYRTDISIRDQVLNNQQPGMKYAPAAPAKKKVIEPRIPDYATKHTGQAIREGKTGLPIATNAGTATAAKPVAAKANGIKLPSEMTTEEIKAALEADKQSAKRAAPVLPTQGDVKEPVSEPAKTEVPKEEKKPVQKQQ